MRLILSTTNLQASEGDFPCLICSTTALAPATLITSSPCPVATTAPTSLSTYKPAPIIGELAMFAELRAVVECDGAACFQRQGGEHGDQAVGDGFCLLAGLKAEQGETGLPFMSHQDGAAATAAQHEVGFPMAGLLPTGHARWSLGDGDAVGDEVDAAAALAAPPATLELGARQQTVQIVLVAAHPPVDVAVN